METVNPNQGSLTSTTSNANKGPLVMSGTGGKPRARSSYSVPSLAEAVGKPKKRSQSMLNLLAPPQLPCTDTPAQPTPIRTQIKTLSKGNIANTLDHLGHAATGDNTPHIIVPKRPFLGFIGSSDGHQLYKALQEFNRNKGSGPKAILDKSTGFITLPQDDSFKIINANEVVHRPPPAQIGLIQIKDQRYLYLKGHIRTKEAQWDLQNWQRILKKYGFDFRLDSLTPDKLAAARKSKNATNRIILIFRQIKETLFEYIFTVRNKQIWNLKTQETQLSPTPKPASTVKKPAPPKSQLNSSANQRTQEAKRQYQRRLREHLQVHCLEEKPCAGDGNCGFHAVRCQLNEPLTQEQLRLKICKHVGDNQRAYRYKNTSTTTRGKLYKRGLVIYDRWFRKPLGLSIKHWFDAALDSQLVANTFGRPVHVYAFTAGTDLFHSFEPFPEFKSSNDVDPIRIQHNGSNHWTAIVPKSIEIQNLVAQIALTKTLPDLLRLKETIAPYAETSANLRELFRFQTFSLLRKEADPNIASAFNTMFTEENLVAFIEELLALDNFHENYAKIRNLILKYAIQYHKPNLFNQFIEKAMKRVSNLSSAIDIATMLAISTENDYWNKTIPKDPNKLAIIDQKLLEIVQRAEQQGYCQLWKGDAANLRDKVAYKIQNEQIKATALLFVPLPPDLK